MIGRITKTPYSNMEEIEMNGADLYLVTVTRYGIKSEIAIPDSYKSAYTFDNSLQNYVTYTEDNKLLAEVGSYITHVSYIDSKVFKSKMANMYIKDNILTTDIEFDNSDYVLLLYKDSSSSLVTKTTKINSSSYTKLQYTNSDGTTESAKIEGSNIRITGQVFVVGVCVY